MIVNRRNRMIYAAILFVVIVSGLGSRSFLVPVLPFWVATYAGDTLWALMVFLGVGFLFTGARTLSLALVALVIAFGVECFQLCDADWINVIRDTRVGALVLGSGFLASDFICYSVGIAMGVVGEWLFHRRLRLPDKSRS